jgi:hypothetical protein
MHASIDHLLSLRDGEPVDAATAAHVEQCPHCSAELRRLQQAQAKLQAVPQLDAPLSFAELQQAMARPRAPSRRVLSGRLVAAAALGTLAVIVFVAIRDDTAPVVAHVDPHSVESPAAPANAVAPVQMTELVAQSQHLEDLLQRLPERPRIERVSTAATIDTIEQRIQWLDFQLSDAPDSGLNEEQTHRLWRERVELMDSLVKVRYAEGGVTF